MKKSFIFGVLAVVLALSALYVVQSKKTSEESARRLLGETVEIDTVTRDEFGSIGASTTLVTKTNGSAVNISRKTALLADGCFWCVENDVEEVIGVIAAVSGYAGGSGENPTYENYSENGFREVVLVTYDANKVSFANLVEHIIKHGDPTDPAGSFHDRGVEYAPAIYYETDSEKADARRVIDAIDATKVFDKPLPLISIPRVKFWPAEEYHQDYAKKNPIRYSYYRGGSGRDAFIEKYWGKSAGAFTVSNYSIPQTAMMSTLPIGAKFWESYVKPQKDELRLNLTPTQFEVTQEEGTERPFDNIYNSNNEEGIYVDVLSGEPLYLSKDKFESGTGWPSFVKPINDSVVALKEDKQLFSTRVEVRSRFGDNHLGHVFEDGPAGRGGRRYCMNSAALRFVGVADMEKVGYGEYLPQLK